MDKDDFVYKKSLGQCFLRDRKALTLIGSYLRERVDKGSSIVEIGPGQGALTRMLLELRPRRLILVERDSRLIGPLKERFPLPSVEVIKADFRRLDMDLEDFYLVGNIPYYITGDVLEIMLLNPGIKAGFFMLQRELFDKLTSFPGKKKYSYLSVVMQVFFDIEKALSLPARAFYPVPKVSSVFVGLLPVKNLINVDKQRRQRFLSIVRQAFINRRKKLKKNLSTKLLPYFPSDWLDRRAQEFSPQAWREILLTQ